MDMLDCWSFTCPWTFSSFQNLAILSLFCRYYLGRYLSELAKLVPLPYSRRRSSCYSDRLLHFSVTIARHYKDASHFSLFTAHVNRHTSKFICAIYCTHKISIFLFCYDYIFPVRKIFSWKDFSLKIK